MLAEVLCVGCGRGAGGDRSDRSIRCDGSFYEIFVISVTQTSSFMLWPGNLKHVPQQLSASECGLVIVESSSSLQGDKQGD